ncbi:MAG: roadblock/LC7 domain-containing protein [Planctomycetes bacterium]|nr:roadblock/LC7 domain-containing protein [Planctomycetota bacterium]
MQDLLTQLNRVRGVGGSLMVSADGLPMASALRAGTDEAALSAAMGEVIGATQRMAQLFGLGLAQNFIAHTDQGGLLILAAGPAFVAVLIDPTANTALLQIEAKSVIDRIAGRLTL